MGGAGYAGPALSSAINEQSAGADYTDCDAENHRYVGTDTTPMTVRVATFGRFGWNRCRRHNPVDPTCQRPRPVASNRDAQRRTATHSDREPRPRRTATATGREPHSDAQRPRTIPEKQFDNREPRRSIECKAIDNRLPATTANKRPLQ